MVNSGGTRGRRHAVMVLALALVLVAGACSGSDDGTGEGDQAAPATTAPSVEHPHDDELRMNELQVLGTHNSYHQRPDPTFAAALDELIPGITQNWDYEHPPLGEQLADQGIRQLELDVFADPEGGLYAQRRAEAYAGLPLEPEPELSEPGTKVLHIQEIDARTSCLTFVACLEEVETWSSQHPAHLPILVLVEAKADEIPDPLDLDFQPPLPWTAERLDVLDEEIRSVFDDDQLVTPDLVRGDAATLEEAVLTEGWPTLSEARGRVMFALDNGGDVMEAYQEGHPSLEGRVMFTGGDPAGTPETAFMKLNDSIDDFDAIVEAVEAGYVVRTRGDAGTVPGDRDPVAVRDAALDSGAQYVSTDYPVPDPKIDPDFSVTIPDGVPARCNPVSAPDWCEPSDLEDPALLSG